MFYIGDTIEIIRGTEKPEYGFYISHNANYPDKKILFGDSEISRIVGYSDIVMVSKNGKKNYVIMGDYPKNTFGYLRAHDTRMVLTEKSILISYETPMQYRIDF